MSINGYSLNERLGRRLHFFETIEKPQFHYNRSFYKEKTVCTAMDVKNAPTSPIMENQMQLASMKIKQSS